MTAFKEFHILYHKVCTLSWGKVLLGCFLPNEGCIILSVLAGDKDTLSGIRVDDKVIGEEVGKGRQLP